MAKKAEAKKAEAKKQQKMGAGCVTYTKPLAAGSTPESVFKGKK